HSAQTRALPAALRILRGLASTGGWGRTRMPVQDDTRHTAHLARGYAGYRLLAAGWEGDSRKPVADSRSQPEPAGDDLALQVVRADRKSTRLNSSHVKI